ncbi:hypothetical protein N9A89_07295, partial [Akkermansiaceae bacterium]|nr:hypothetical protein [Akkermansiaceae bacterium]
MRKAKEITVQELKESSSYRKERGYLYFVDARIGGARYRRFFRHGERKKADAFVSSLMAKRDNVGNAKAAILEDPDTQEMAARAVRKLAESGSSLTLEQAVDDYLARFAVTLSRSSVSVSAVIDAFLHEKEREGVSEPHYKDLDHRTKRFAGSFGDESISTITEKEVSDWLMGLSLEPQTVVNFRRVLHNLFAFAVKRGHISTNPVAHAISPKVRRKRAVILSPEEASSLLAHAEASADESLQEKQETVAEGLEALAEGDQDKALAALEKLQSQKIEEALKQEQAAIAEDAKSELAEARSENAERANTLPEAVAQAEAARDAAEPAQSAEAAKSAAEALAEGEGESISQAELQDRQEQVAEAFAALDEGNPAEALATLEKLQAERAADLAEELREFPQASDYNQALNEAQNKGQDAANRADQAMKEQANGQAEQAAQLHEQSSDQFEKASEALAKAAEQFQQ